MAPALIPLAIAAIPSVLKTIQGIGQGIKGNKLAKQNKRPTYEIPKEFQQNLAIAENMGRIGLPQQQYNQAQQNFQRNQASALRQFNRMGNPRGLAGIVRAGNDATLGLDVADAEARMSNQRNAMGYRSQVGQQQLAKQNWDKMQLFGERADAAAALQGAGRQNVMGGLSELSQLGQMALMDKMSNIDPNMATGVSQSPYGGNFGNYGQLGQFGTRLGGMQGMGSFGGNYNYPRTQMPFMPKFFPKKF